MSKGNIIKISNGIFNEVSKNDYTIFAETIKTNAAGKIVENSKEGIVFGEPVESCTCRSRK